MAVRGGQGQERGGRGDAQWTVCYTSINVLKQAVDSKRASLPSSLWGGGQSSVLCGILKGHGQRRGKAAPGAQTLACSTQTQVAWGRGWGAPRCETHTHAASSVRTREPSMQMHVCTQIYGHTQSHLSTWRLSEFAFLGQPSTGLEAPKPL